MTENPLQRQILRAHTAVPGAVRIGLNGAVGSAQSVSPHQIERYLDTVRQPETEGFAMSHPKNTGGDGNGKKGKKKGKGKKKK